MKPFKELDPETQAFIHKCIHERFEHLHSLLETAGFEHKETHAARAHLEAAEQEIDDLFTKE